MKRPSHTMAKATLATISVLAAAMPISAAHAQSVSYGDVAASGDETASAPDEGKPGKKAKRGRSGGRNLAITPYIEVNQIVDAELSPGNEVLTYTQIAAGVDAAISGRNNGAAASVRYERHFGWGKNSSDGDVISGLARGYTTLTRGVTLEAGAIATRARVENGGSALAGGVIDDTSTTNIYSIYGGPSLATRAGDIDVSANYRAGFTKVEQANGYVAVPGGAAADVFDKSVMQVADVEAGVAPGLLLPVGVGAAGSFYQEDISNLDQRVRDAQVRGIVTLPVGHSVQVTGAIGYEDVEVSSRDVLRGPDGEPVVGSDGRYKTDKSAPRVLSYDVSGLLWDVGVEWRPSRRTALTAHFGRRYGSDSFNGTFSWSPDDRKTLSVAIYDNVSGFGGQLNRFIDELPDDFEAVRDPLTGDLGTCVNSLQGSNCLGGALGSVRSATFRARGIAASYAMKLGRLNAGIGVGYDRRKFLAARGTILASAAGVIDENTWLAAYLSGDLGRDAGWSTNVYANWLSSGDALAGDVAGYGATAAYYRLLTRRLRATVAEGIDAVTRDDPLFDDIWTASALAGVRYSF